jgi:hypothetical protein
VARQVAAQLKQLGFGNIAVLGSLARGDDAKGSDVDLWVLADRDETVNTTVRGVAVTLLYETPARARDPRHWLRVEVAHAKILSDVDGAFARIQRAFSRAASRIRSRIERATRSEQREWLRRSRQGSSRARLTAVRHAAMRAVCLPVFLATGVRDPRFRHLRAFYPPHELTRVRQALGLERKPKGLVGALKGLPSAQAKLRAGEWEEAVLNARLHGRELDARVTAADVERARAGLEALLSDLKPSRAARGSRRRRGPGRRGPAPASSPASAARAR